MFQETLETSIIFIFACPAHQLSLRTGANTEHRETTGEKEITAHLVHMSVVLHINSLSSRAGESSHLVPAKLAQTRLHPYPLEASFNYFPAKLGDPGVGLEQGWERVTGGVPGTKNPKCLSGGFGPIYQLNSTLPCFPTHLQSTLLSAFLLSSIVSISM
jgi:hypothetical protein